MVWFRVLMSPAMIGGRYGGALSKEHWVELNQLTLQGQQLDGSQGPPTKDDNPRDHEGFNKKRKEKSPFGPSQKNGSGLANSPPSPDER
ncbi:hypothetical protein [Rhizobium sp. MHM7A]|uniref:hypothetical protein n=1 Tax=Rhizobium sp. MHM7A TaxID=2583233 RepID=UPI0011067BDE|nr:hypothetical protein [Rhizobium sp. MHM7A]TLX14149.1 hypothetical protein FFR93_10210 [Rhizobium sp. MHM7A]